MHPLREKLKLLIIAGARPNFMKIAPLIKAAHSHNSAASNDDHILDWRLVHTGQHYDQKMSQIFFDDLGIPAPDINLEVGSGSHALQTAQVMIRFESICLEEKPDWVVVVGDVNSTLSCTLVAVKMGIKVAHVEAGLRSFDRTMPEEINRIVTDALSHLLLTPSEDATTNLLHEGVPHHKIKFVGNIMIDALVSNLEKARRRRTHEHLGLIQDSFVYVTLHRPSNVDQRESLVAIMDELKWLSTRWPVVFPVHPRTRKMIAEFGISFQGHSGLNILEPIGYHDSLCLAEHARLLLTDSGGLQEESTFFGTTCLTLRPNTERPVTISHGTNKLTNLVELRSDLLAALETDTGTARVPALWDGKTAERVVQEIVTA